MSDERKIVFVDVDGTIYKSHQTEIDDSIKRKLEEASKKVDLFISTGRSDPTLVLLGDARKYFKGLVLSNGSYVIYDNKKLTEKVIKKEDLINLVNACKKMGCSIGLVNNDKVYVNKLTEVVDRALTPRYENSLIDIDGYDFNFDLNYNMCWIFDPVEVIDELEPFIPNFSIFRWGKVGADINIKGVSKAKGILELLEYLNHSLHNTYALGDASNDIAMLKLVECGIAMDNGTEEAKQAAKHVTKSLYEGGFEEAIDKILEGEW